MADDLTERLGPILEAYLPAVGLVEALAVTAVTRLPGGAIHHHYRLDGIAVRRHQRTPVCWVLRTPASPPLGLGLGLSQAQAVQAWARAQGVTTPESLHCCVDGGIIGRPFGLMAWMPGSADPAACAVGGDDLAMALGAELAKLHAAPWRRFPLATALDLGPRPALARIAQYRRWLDALDWGRPALEWALAWLAHHAPPPGPRVLCHGDFRTGNYLVVDGRLSALLDWEFAAVGDPLEDIGWFCAPCWRYGRFDLVGGVGRRRAFYRGYRRQALKQGLLSAWSWVAYWEIMALVRWGIIALHQGRRRFGAHPDEVLALALTAREVTGIEAALLAAVARYPAPWGE
ncbi:MAG: phosphotransferase family protein [Candidatus Competibacterales bacterium]